ncbi:MAG: type I DNA topoisomerase [Deltaproteobacteria bacterium]|nr:type I DNA topoisomerase [Deltaproteobacteria bacterium]
MGNSLVIVESPTKARTIEKFLDGKFTVISSYGHIRDLPTNASEIPTAVKKEKWARIGINVDDNFKPLYVIPDDKKKHITQLKKLAQNATELYLATDEDREGESISWHLVEVLKPKVPVKRMVFHEITHEAIQRALDSPRGIDFNMVRAQETRRIIDRLFGYMVSPLLWKKMAPGLSAGRVQSVAMRLLVERERQRIAFKSAAYWDLKATFQKQAQIASRFDATLARISGKRVASGKDFDPLTGKLEVKDDLILLDEGSAKRLKEELLSKPAHVSAVETKPYTTRPYAPFTTSTLQQEASRKLRFAVRRTMQVAQQLYENGLITYMRTDSTHLSDEALSGARRVIERDFGREFLPPAPRTYKTQVKNAQEAHEAIRPAGADFVSPSAVKNKLGSEAFKLYEMIWKRTLASQMKDAKGTRIMVDITCGEALFKASGKTIEFPGYLRAYVEGSDDPEAELADQEIILPNLEKGESLQVKEISALSHATQPVARFTEGSLIKELERLGIGRPSTWATIVDLVLSRTYAFKKGTALVPTFLACALTNLMEGYFTKLVDYGFTASLEDDLDAISRGEAENIAYLKLFYYGNEHLGLQGLVSQGEEQIDPRQVCGIPIGKAADGREIEVRIGRWGPFLTDGETRSGLPKELPPDELTLEAAVSLLEEAKKGPSVLGHDPDSNKPVYLKSGRFGPYVQLGDGDSGKGKERPKMASLLQGMQPESVDLDTALALLALPRSLGINPTNQEEVIAANGRYGPYIKCGSDTRTIPTESASPLSITLDEALKLLAEPKQRGRSIASKVLKEIGVHPDSNLSLTVKSGRYGPYVTDGVLNASLPTGTDPAEVTVELAANLLSERAAKVAANAAAGITRGRKSKRGGTTKTKTATKTKTTTKTKTKKEVSPKKALTSRKSPKKASPEEKA